MIERVGVGNLVGWGLGQRRRLGGRSTVGSRLTTLGRPSRSDGSSVRRPVAPPTGRRCGWRHTRRATDARA